MKFKDLFSELSTTYALYRPNYPDELFGYLASVTPANDTAWDCATGNGQAAIGLTPYFRSVIATDGSEQQLARAIPHKRISYLHCSAEYTGIAPRSVDLLTVAQAAHWFQFNEFYAEVRRVVKPGGIIALWCYHLFQCSPEIDSLVRHYDQVTLADYWSPGRELLNELYRTIPFPFDEFQSPLFPMSVEWNFFQLVGFLESWSAPQKYREIHGTNPLDLIRGALTEAWGDVERKRTVCWNLHLRTGTV